MYEITTHGLAPASGTATILRKKDGKALKAFSLATSQITAGTHDFKWNGSVDSSADFPDGFVTIEHSPYQVKIEIAGEAGPKNLLADILDRMERPARDCNVAFEAVMKAAGWLRHSQSRVSASGARAAYKGGRS